ncbi:MAG: proline--tRNA ligase [Myxococcales bacterium]|nr:proline--tRNA ligase [Myxococcales bacterium]MCZ6713753.1 proline--tRNA ligase [Deltaproteobacteria bacterium]TDI98325.1 MAG: proline--tRNA ligase [Deltaproteobacteria bacterium]
MSRMRWSGLFIPTLREDPADAEAISHRLMLRGGFIRQLGAGIYSMLPLGFRVLRRVDAIVREEMERIGAQEFLLPALHPAELWKESGRWEEMGEAMFRLRDRKQAELCLGMTHEEVFTAIARDELRSYRQLPQIWYQIQTKFRDEARPKSGVLRGRQFTMKDSYSFDLDSAGADRSFDLHAEVYRRIFARCGLDVIEVEASSGAMGGSESVEFMAISDAGEDWVVTCSGCGYAANLEKAISAAAPIEDPEDTASPEKFATPGIHTIEELAQFPGGAPAERQIKTLAYVAEEALVLLLLRGDHELNEVKAIETLGTTNVRPGRPEEIREALGALPGSLGAVGVTQLPVYVDETLRGRRGMTTGANEDGFHLRHVDVERDLPSPRWADLRGAQAGDACSKCSKLLEVQKSIEVGHIFKLGVRYSESMGARVLDAAGKEVPIVMGSYGIGLERIMAAVIEAHHDKHGIRWPVSIAPFQVVVVSVNVKQAEQASRAEQIYDDLRKEGLDVLLDDRDERPGVKFKDADLVGIPYRVVLGPRALAKGNVELFERATSQTVEVSLDQIVAELKRRLG